MSLIELFNKIVELTSTNTGITAEDILSKKRTEDVCIARCIVVFWCTAAGFSCQTMLKMLNKRGNNSIRSIQQLMEYNWINRYSYRTVVRAVGTLLKKYINSLGEEFDVESPLKLISKMTDKQ